MEKKVKEFLELSQDESEAVSRIVVPPQRPGTASLYEDFALRSIRVDRVEPGLVVCTLKVPPRLTAMFVSQNLGIGKGKCFISCVWYSQGRETGSQKDRAGNLAKGAIANIVDMVGGYVTYVEGLPMYVSVDISISYISTAKLDDELEITSKRLGKRGAYYGAIVLLRNKATGEIIAEGRHSMFRPRSTHKL